jgi:hypothetical protein
MAYRAFRTERGEPKSHFRRSCKICIETQCGCSLPFRKMRQVRRWNALDNKPILPKYKIRFMFRNWGTD